MAHGENKAGGEIGAGVGNREGLPDTVSWIETTGLSRRAMLAGSAAAAGYALAAQPVMADAIHTPATGLDAAMLTFPTTGGLAMRAYRARPAGRKDLPVVLVVQEIFGLHEWVQDVTRRFAHAGYYAIAPDLYQRHGDPTKMADIRTLSQDIVSRVGDAEVMADLDHAAAFAATEGAAAMRLGIVGFCWGGRISWLYAEHNPHLKAAVAFYGRPAGNKTPLQPQNPIDLVAQLKAPVLAFYGAEDQGIPLADVEKMRQALAAARLPGRIEVFPGAGHGFFADYRPSYHEEAAKKAWPATLDWFRRYL